jgi:hypothetical protein
MKNEHLLAPGAHFVYLRIFFASFGLYTPLYLMPKILEYFGIVFYFYSNEHLPIHVHVSYGEYESIFEFHFENGALVTTETRKSAVKPPLPPAQMRDAQKIVEIYTEDIVSKWTDFFVLKKKIKSTKITKRL